MTTIQLRRLSQELVRLRKQAGLTVEDVTVAMEWSKGRLTYLEKAKGRRVDIGVVSRLLELYSVEESERAALIDLARQTRVKGWWVDYRDIFPASFPSFENAATMIRAYETVLVPGLLQTPGYTEAIMRGGQGEVIDPQTVQRRVEARMARQRILARDQPPDLWAIFDEAALHRMVGGPEVMREQIRHLIEMAARSHITIQVIPNSIGAHAAMTGGSFVLLDFASSGDPSLVYLEEAASSLFVDKREDVQAYALIFGRVTSTALTPDETVSFMMELRDNIT